MADNAGYPVSEVAVTLIEQGGRILAVYNEPRAWFSLPMTKRRRWYDPSAPAGSEERIPKEEEWIDAAVRAVAEWLGTTSSTEPKSLGEITGRSQGDLDGTWKLYAFHAYQVSLRVDQGPRSGAVAQWLTVDEFLDENRRPIGGASRYIIRELGKAAASQQAAFPEPGPPW